MWFPAYEDLLHLHDLVLASGGGERGILRPGGIEAAVERARWGPFGGSGDLAERAALLVRGIAADHPFADGNKRTAFLAADVFARRNGWFVDATADEVVDFMLAVALGEADLDATASWIAARLRRL